MKFLFDHDMPDDLGHVLRQLGHTVVLLREALPRTAPDPEVLAYAAAHDLIVLFRRKTRAAERAALVRLLAGAGEQGLANNVNFA